MYISYFAYPFIIDGVCIHVLTFSNQLIVWLLMPRQHILNDRKEAKFWCYKCLVIAFHFNLHPLPCSQVVHSHCVQIFHMKYTHCHSVLPGGFPFSRVFGKCVVMSCTKAAKHSLHHIIFSGTLDTS